MKNIQHFKHNYICSLISKIILGMINSNNDEILFQNIQSKVVPFVGFNFHFFLTNYSFFLKTAAAPSVQLLLVKIID